MTSYRAYGVSIASEIPLPPLPIAESPAEVRIRFGNVTAPRPPVRQAVTTFRGEIDDGVLATPEVAFVHVRQGRDVIVERAGDAPDDAIRAMLLGPVIAVLMSQRGLMTLHASAVALNGQAVAFMGDAGWGKSTLAATLHRRGHQLVADDVLAVSFDDGQPHVPPAVPQLRLTPEAIGLLGDDPARFPRVWHGTDKRAQAVPELADAPLLSRVYVLAPNSADPIAPIPASDATIEFVRHSFAVRSLHRAAPDRYLRQAARLAESVQVLRLGRADELRRIHEVADAVELDLGVAS